MRAGGKEGQEAAVLASEAIVGSPLPFKRTGFDLSIPAPHLFCPSTADSEDLEDEEGLHNLHDIFKMMLFTCEHNILSVRSSRHVAAPFTLARLAAFALISPPQLS